jgi:UDP-glucose 4-epimerase
LACFLRCVCVCVCVCHCSLTLPLDYRIRTSLSIIDLVRGSICDAALLDQIFSSNTIQAVIHLLKCRSLRRTGAVQF